MPLAVPTRRRGLLVAALIVASGCAGIRAHGTPAAPAVLIFTNETIDQAAVFCTVSGGSAVRIGTVVPGRTDTLYLTQAMTGSVGSVHITARLLGRSTVAQTGNFSIQPGDLWLIRLPYDARRLFVTPP